MGCSSSLDCTNLTASNTITVLPDIVGIGILASFLLTAALACLTVIASYFIGALPDDWLGEADHAIIQRWRHCSACATRYNAEVRGSGQKVSSPMCKHNDPDLVERRRESINTFLLTLSDQQLVTGLAMVIAALVKHCSLSYYEFSVVANLAWLSSTTHLTTLVVLQPYLRERLILRNVRMFAIFCNLILLVYITLITSAAAASNVDGSASIQCILNDLPRMLRKARSDLSTYVSIWFLIDSHWNAISNVGGFHPKFWKRFTWCYCVWFLSNTDPLPGAPVFHAPEEDPPVYHKTRKRISWLHWSSSNLTEDGFEIWAAFHLRRPKNVHRWSRKWDKARNLVRGPVAPKDPHSPAAIREASRNPRTKFGSVRKFDALLSDYSSSFFSAIPVFLWSLSYGVTGTVISRQLKPNVEGSENELDFGQIVPLFLLLLPLSAILETYYDINKGTDDSLSLSKAEPGSFWRRVLQLLKMRMRHNIQEAVDPDVEEGGDGRQAEKSDESQSKPKSTVSAISSPSPDDAAPMTTNSSENFEDMRPNPYQDQTTRRLFYYICFCYLALEVTSGITAGLTPYFIILWAMTKIVTYISQIFWRIQRLIYLHIVVHDLPRFAKAGPHDTEPENPSPQEALESLLLMITEPKPNSIKGEKESQPTTKLKFDEMDVKSMERLLKSLRAKAKKEMVDKRAVQNTSTDQNKAVPEKDIKVALSSVQERSDLKGKQRRTDEIEIQSVQGQ